MSARPWYRRYGADFIAGTLTLSLEEKGAYSIILDLIYDRGGPIPDEPRYIAGVCGCSLRKWSAIRARLIDAGKIAVRDGRITNQRAEKEIEIATKSACKLAESGSKGGLKRAENAAVARENNDIEQAELKHRAHKPYPDIDTSLRSVEKRAQARGSRLPIDWRPSEADWQSAREAGLTSKQAEAEALNFADYWHAKPGKDALKLDWPATWRSWCRRAFDRLPKPQDRDHDLSRQANPRPAGPAGPALNRADRAARVTLAAVGLGTRSGLEDPWHLGEDPTPADDRGKVVDLGPGDFAAAQGR